MAQITKNTDGDTFRVDGTSTRVLGINTDESVAVNEDRNTQSGRDASDKAKIIAPVGTEVRTEEAGKGKFGRTLADVKIQTAKGEVDYGLVALDQSMSKYSIEYGKHPNPEQHDLFKEYFSQNAPYQYADYRELLDREEYATVAKNIDAFNIAHKQYEDGEISREAYEDAMYTAYGDGEKVARFRYQNMQWQRDFDMKQYDGSDRMAYDWAHQSKENREKYDLAIRNSHTGFRSNPEKDVGFWKSLAAGTETAFSMFNDIAVLNRYKDLSNARKYSDDKFDVSDEELVRGVPPEYHNLVMQEAEEYGDDSALQYRDNLLKSLQNEEDFNELPLATQIVTAIPAVLASPVTLATGGVVGTGVIKVTKTIDDIMAVGRLRNLRIPAKVVTWAAAGALETGASGTPRLGTDANFTSADMLNEMKYGAAFGVVVPAAMTGISNSAKRLQDYSARMKQAQQSIQRETEELAGRPPVTLEKPRIRVVSGGVIDPETAKVKSVHDMTREELAAESAKQIDHVLANFSELPYQRGKVSAAVDAATATQTKSLTQTMLESDSRVAKFIGSELLELPEGIGGKVVRQPTAALQQHSLRTRYLSDTQPIYHKLIGEYAGEHGKRGVGKMMAQHFDGQGSPLVNKFSRDVATVLEQRRQGKPVTVTSQAVLKMVDAFENSMSKMFDDLVDAGVSGFSKDRRVKNYFPQLWDNGAMRGAVTKYGEKRVQDVLAKGYLASKHNDIEDMVSAQSAAKSLLDKIKTDDLVDGALPTTVDARAKARLDIDTTVSDGELSIMDLMETDLSTVSAKYANRAAGRVALARKGITGDMDIDELRKRYIAEGQDPQLFDDTINLVMGRPTREGLDPALNEIKDAVSLSKMGGLGMAQAAEMGNVLSRAVLNLFSDPKVFKKIFSLAGESTQDKALMREIQALSGISNDVHLLDRQAVHLDRAALDEARNVRKLGYWIAGKASFGKYKAPAGYILGKVSGFNMIRRFERRIANASFLLDTAKHFKDGTGKMSAARMKDIGLDPEDAQLKRIFRDIVEYDEHGLAKKLNLDKWPKDVRERYHLAMYRDDAQMVQQTIGGEMPAWINRPLMTIVAQFKQQAILANKKQLTRQMQFADKEATLAVLLNTAMAAMTRTAKFATLGTGAYLLTGDESEISKPWEKDYFQAEKYVSTFGFFPDMGHIAYSSFRAFDEDRMSVETAAEGIASEIPMLSWMRDYYTLGTADSLEKKAEAAKGVAILGNMQFADLIYKGIEAQLEDK
jgi:hypothetical protein